MGDEIKHLNALVEDGAKKNRTLISIGSKFSFASLLSFVVLNGISSVLCICS
jgi:hypothetical protein